MCAFSPVHRRSRRSTERVGFVTVFKDSRHLHLLSDSVGSCDHLPTEEGRCSDVLHKHQYHAQENEGEGEDEDETDAEDLRSRPILRVEGVLQGQAEEREEDETSQSRRDQREEEVPH